MRGVGHENNQLTFAPSLSLGKPLSLGPPPGALLLQSPEIDMEPGAGVSFLGQAAPPGPVPVATPVLPPPTGPRFLDIDPTSGLPIDPDTGRLIDRPGMSTASKIAIIGVSGGIVALALAAAGVFK